MLEALVWLIDRVKFQGGIHPVHNKENIDEIKELIAKVKGE